MTPAGPSIEVFIHEDESGEASIGLVICDAGIVEYYDELAPGCCLTATQAALLAAALNQLSQQILETVAT